MHGMIIEGKLAIWAAGVLNLIPRGEETNTFLFRKNSWKCQTTKLQHKWSLTVIWLEFIKRIYSPSRRVPGVSTLKAVLKYSLVLKLCNSWILKLDVIDQPAYKRLLLLVLDCLLRKCKPECLLLVTQLYGCVRGSCRRAKQVGGFTLFTGLLSDSRTHSRRVFCRAL